VLEVVYVFSLMAHDVLNVASNKFLMLLLGVLKPLDGLLVLPTFASF